MNFIIKQAIKQKVDSDSFYTESIWQIYSVILKHSRYDQTAWKQSGDSEFPTPYIVLMKKILLDLQFLVEDACGVGLKPSSTIPYRLVQSWVFIIDEQIKSTGNVSPSYIRATTVNFLEFILKLHFGRGGDSLHRYLEGNQLAHTQHEWSDSFIIEIKKLMRGGSGVRDYLLECANDYLDSGKSYVFSGKQWLIEALANNKQHS